MTQHRGVERALLAVERREALAGRARRTTIVASATGRASKACSGWPELPQHVVGDVDDVADRAAARTRAAARAIQAGDGPHPHAADHARGVAVAEVGRLDAHARERARRLAAIRCSAIGGGRSAAAGQRRQLARDAEHRQAVGPVRRDLDLEHAIVEPEVRDEVGAERRVGVEHQHARLVLLAEPELALRAEHALRLDAADLGDGDRAARRAARRPAARRPRARRRARVRRAADDRVALAPGADPAQHEPVAVALAELALDRLDLADDHARELGRQRRDARAPRCRR